MARKRIKDTPVIGVRRREVRESKMITVLNAVHDAQMTHLQAHGTTLKLRDLVTTYQLEGVLQMRFTRIRAYIRLEKNIEKG